MMLYNGCDEMIRSMTGFGQALRSFNGYTIQMDMKSVNHRYHEIMVRMPREWMKLEERLKKLIQIAVKRGRVDVFVTIEQDPSLQASFEINWSLLDGYVQAANAINERYALESTVKPIELLNLPDALRFNDQAALDEDAFAQEFMECAEEALAMLMNMRETEGRHLLADLQERLLEIERLHLAMVEASPAAVMQYQTKLRSRIHELLDDPSAFDETRFAMEVALMADRTNVDEELTRLASHIEQTRQTLQSSGPIGRKLDFIVQEMNREANTIGSKSNDTSLSQYVVEMKAELEKIREQIQNIE